MRFQILMSRSFPQLARRFAVGAENHGLDALEMPGENLEQLSAAGVHDPDWHGDVGKGDHVGVEAGEGVRDQVGQLPAVGTEDDAGGQA